MSGFKTAAGVGRTPSTLATGSITDYPAFVEYSSFAQRPDGVPRFDKTANGQWVIPPHDCFCRAYTISSEEHFDKLLAAAKKSHNDLATPRGSLGPAIPCPIKQTNAMRKAAANPDQSQIKPAALPGKQDQSGQKPSPAAATPKKSGRKTRSKAAADSKINLGSKGKSKKGKTAKSLEIIIPGFESDDEALESQNNLGRPKTTPQKRPAPNDESGITPRSKVKITPSRAPIFQKPIEFTTQPEYPEEKPDYAALLDYSRLVPWTKAYGKQLSKKMFKVSPSEASDDAKEEESEIDLGDDGGADVVGSKAWMAQEKARVAEEKGIQLDGEI
ncbi:ankyrin repeat domain protein [Colletotrichum sp. SAR11_240]|nr:ankyrin repeat domain protein [Colletotrichum sp. SAR11_240]